MGCSSTSWDEAAQSGDYAGEKQNMQGAYQTRLPIHDEMSANVSQSRKLLIGGLFLTPSILHHVSARPDKSIRPRHHYIVCGLQEIDKKDIISWTVRNIVASRLYLLTFFQTAAFR